MAQQISNISFTGTTDNICFYRMQGKLYARTASSLSGKRVKKDPAFRRTMQNAGLLGKASKISSFVYKALPKAFRQFWMYKAFTGEAMRLLKEGISEEKVKEVLWGRYAEVWSPA